MTEIAVDLAYTLGKGTWKRWKLWREEDPVKHLEKTFIPSQRNQVDVISYTSETMYYPISNILEKISDKLSEERGNIHIRLLFRDCTASFLIRGDTPEENLYNCGVRERARIEAEKWKELESICKSHVIVERRIYRFEPFFKGVLVNSNAGYFGFYRIDVHEKEISIGKTVRKITAWDYLGKESDMMEISNSGNKQQRQLTKQFGDIFEKLWQRSELSHPYVT